ncbi:unnamed protein product [Lymnaea stagnalis]|uniref:AN1-type domain-containing protein n=1 Tax=Lymnaea stagnalis TaxID=6523 RepID=A0AAV2HAB4_LYMST
MELPQIGTNCEVDSCNQLDFLPFQCNGCGKTFCLHHRARDQHSCTAPENERVEYKGDRSYPCSITGCDKRELTPIVCNHCELSFCLSHRLQEDHCCEKLPVKSPEVSKTTEHVQQLLANRELKTRPKPTNPKAIQMAAKVALMKVKAKAVGDQGLPQSERVYFTISLPLDSRKPPVYMFFSKIWTIGRVIDVVADKVSITNKNNTGSEKKLCLFLADTGLRLPVDKRIFDIMDDQSSLLLSGSTLVMEYVVDGVEILENIASYKT